MKHNDTFERIADRPTDMLLRQLAANRAAARGRDKHGRKLFCHLMPFRPHFVREMLAMRAELKKRRVLNMLIDNAVFAR